jgi:hypothetical protein
MGRKATETTRNINQAFGHGTVNEYTSRYLFTKFRNGDDRLEDEERRVCPSAIDDIQLRAIIEADQCKATREVAEELNVDHSTVVRHLYQTGKSKELEKLLPHELSENHKIRCYKFCCALFLRNKNNPFFDRILIYDEKWIYTTTDGVLRSGWTEVKHQNSYPNRSCKKVGYGHCLVVRTWTDPLQLFESWRNHHSREVLPGNQQNAPRTAMFMSNIGQSKRTNSSP